MRIVLIAFGSRGDVQPHLALGAGLRRAGHSVRVITHRLFEPLALQLGLDFAPVSIDPRGIVEGEQGQDWLGSGTNAIQFLRRFTHIAGPLIERTLRECWQASQDANLLIFSPLGIGTVSSITEKLAIPYWIGAGQPLTPTSAFAIPFFPPAPGWLPGPGRALYHRSTYLVSGRLFWQLLRPSINNARRDILNLPPLPANWLTRQMRQQLLPMLYYYSPSILPAPPDWNERNHVTGYWHLEDLSTGQSTDSPGTWQPPADLLAFLASGPPPLYIGFGSMRPRDPARLTTIIQQALSQTDHRAILATGWGGIQRNQAENPTPGQSNLSHQSTNLSNAIYTLDYVPHDWLFPRLSAVIHHGGAGTTAATIRHGLPAVILPFFGDQPFWSRHYTSLGVIPPPIPIKNVTADRLVHAIEQATGDKAMRERMKALSEKVREENGVQRAVEVITNDAQRN
jgi:sterol 3beta-glucosyltransferase